MAGERRPVVFIAGASGGIGSQLAARFADAQVVVHGFRHGVPGEGVHVQADVRDTAAVERAVGEALAATGRIDVLVNATGLSVDGFAHKQAPERWREVVETNLLGSYNLVRAVLPSMREQGYGRIVLLSSVVHQRPVLGTSAYSASKAALSGLARTVALENASKGVTCNCIALGYFDAGMLHKLPEALREETRKAVPLQRFGRVDELYRTVRFLVDTEYMTGQTLSLNGGLFMD